MHGSIIELWSVMGPLARGIVALLLAMSVASLAAAADRWFAIRTAAGRIDDLLKDCRAVLAAPLAADARREAYDRSVRKTLVGTSAGLRRGMGAIATVGSTAPFVGLVGTVLGIVNAFQQLAESGHGAVGEVSGGIAEALVTTAFGIGVAIPAVWLFNLLTGRIRDVVSRLECRAQELAVAALEKAR
jgi:biopolymer transport protein ExbB/TolQ